MLTRMQGPSKQLQAFLFVLGMLVQLGLGPAVALGPTVCVLDGIVEFSAPISDESEVIAAYGTGSLTCSGLFNLNETATISLQGGTTLPTDDGVHRRNCGLIAAVDLFVDTSSDWELFSSLSGRFDASSGPSILSSPPRFEDLKVGAGVVKMRALRGDCATGVQAAHVESTVVLEDASNVVPMVCYLDATVDFTRRLSNTSTTFTAVGRGRLFCNGADLILDYVEVELLREQGSAVEPGGSCSLITGAKLSTAGYSRLDLALIGTAEDMAATATMRSKRGHAYAGGAYVQLHPVSGNCDEGISSATITVVAIMSGITRSAPQAG